MKVPTTIEVVKDCGHTLVYQNPQNFADAVNRCLEYVRPMAFFFWELEVSGHSVAGVASDLERFMSLPERYVKKTFFV
jgi:hypothetical protein